MTNNAEFFTQQAAEINGRHIWFYMTTTPIGNILIVQYEDCDLEIQSLTFMNDYEKAEKAFKMVVKKILDGQL